MNEWRCSRKVKGVARCDEFLPLSLLSDFTDAFFSAPAVLSNLK